jgi:hypothetical protein
MNKENVIYKFPPMGYYSNIKKKKRRRMELPFQPIMLENWISTGRRLRLDFLLLALYKCQFKMNQGLNILHVTLKVLDGNIGKALQSVGTGNDFLRLKSSGSRSKN